MKILLLLGSLLLPQSRLPISVVSGQVVAGDASSAAGIRVVLIPSTTIFVFPRPSEVRLSGRVNDLPNPLPGALRAVLRPSDRRAQPTEVAVAGDGTFEFPKVPSGAYTLGLAGQASPTIRVEVDAKNIEGVVLYYLNPNTPEPIRVLAVAGPTVSMAPPPGSSLLSVSQSGRGWGAGNREGALSFFRIERAGVLVEEQRLYSAQLTFALTPGSYELVGYFRGCNNSCFSLWSPQVQCTVPFTVAAGQAMYVERIVQNDTCSIRFNTPPR